MIDTMRSGEGPLDPSGNGSRNSTSRVFTLL